VIIGRGDPTLDVDLSAYDQSSSISRRHACVRIQGGQVSIEDLKSTNGTSVNMQQLPNGQPQALADGDEVCFGRLVLTVRIG